MIKKVLYLPIETLARELDANLFLAHAALRRGYDVLLGGKGEVKELARAIGGGVYLYKHWESEFPYGFDHEKRKNFYYAGMHQEGLVWIDTETFVRRMTEMGRSEKLNVNFVKGEMQKRILSEQYPNLKPILEVVGSPTFDILRPEYRKLFEGEAERLRQKWGSYVLINTNFAHGNWSRHIQGDMLALREKESVKNVGRPLTEAEKQKLTGSVEFKKRMIDAYAEMVVAMSKKFPEVTFILRPHPSEDHENWRYRLNGIRNARVLYEGNVVTWILGAMCVVHSGCTTALEAWALGVPVIRYNPFFEHTPYESELPNKFGTYAASLEGLEARIGTARDLRSAKEEPSKDEVLEPYMSSVNGPLSSHRILDHIERTCDLERTDNLLSLLRARWGLYDRLRALAHWIVVSVSMRPKLSRYVIGAEAAARRAAAYQKFPGISRRHVRSRVDLLEQLLPSAGTLQIERVGESVVYLGRTNS